MRTASDLVMTTGGDLVMTTAGDLVNILGTTRSPRVLLTVHPDYVAPVYGAQAVISVAGAFHGTVVTCLYSNISKSNLLY